MQSSSQRWCNTFPPGPRVALPERKWRQELTHHPESWVPIFLLAQCCHPDNWETRQKELKAFLQLGMMPGYQDTYIKWLRFKLFTIKTELVELKIQSFLVECLPKYTKPWIWPNTTYSGHGGRSLKLCVETGRPEIQGHPEAISKFEASLVSKLTNVIGWHNSRTSRHQIKTHRSPHVQSHLLQSYHSPFIPKVRCYISSNG